MTPTAAAAPNACSRRRGDAVVTARVVARQPDDASLLDFDAQCRQALAVVASETS
jgi:hypothetical protein